MAEHRSTPLPPLGSPDPDSIPVEKWVAGEDPIREVLNCIYPTLDSEEKRKDVTEYMQKLIKSSAGVEVFPYGSVPLKTYLPEGDIDLTALGDPNNEKQLPLHVFHLLENEERKVNNEFKVKEVQFIDAEVKLVKCIVQGIVVDISFNQLGGLYTLCFLEQVDRIIARDHLFKRSIILIKVWCYYESRILGANVGLISTYALEVLVLYIFHFFGASLTSPLVALYRFLNYYSKFQWEDYCLSLDGPIVVYRLPVKEVENPVIRRHDALINAEFLKKCMDMFTVPSKEEAQIFIPKNLNIIDPLKGSNNLGRSVPRGNYFRIRSAFKLGARRLGEVLLLPNEDIGEGIRKFFVDTLKRHKPKEIDHGVPSTFGTLSSPSFSEANYEDELQSNGDLEDDYYYLSGLDDVSTLGSGEGCDLSAFQDLSLKSDDDDEVVDEDSQDDNLSDVFLFDFRNLNATGGETETETPNPFSDLTGDYDSSLRSLAFGQRYRGYALTADLVRASLPTSSCGHAGPPAVAVSLPPPVNPMAGQYASYPSGQSPARSGQRPVRGSGPYIPIRNSSTGGTGRVVRGPALPSGQPHVQQLAHGGPVVHAGGSGRSGERRPVNTQRKLVFGSFPLLIPTFDADGSTTYVACGRDQGSVEVNQLLLRNDDEFPPLAA